MNYDNHSSFFVYLTALYTVTTPGNSPGASIPPPLNVFPSSSYFFLRKLFSTDLLETSIESFPAEATTENTNEEKNSIFNCLL